MNQKVIKNKNIYIVDKHNEVLKAWIDVYKRQIYTSIS